MPSTESLPFHLHDECALITGGGTGLGLGIARCFVASGARVILVGRREAELRATVATLGPLATYVPHDVTQHDQADEFLASATRQAGAPPTILVNNAGIHLKKPATDTTAAEFASVLNTHVLGAHALTRAILPSLVECGHGSILFIASMASLFGIPQVTAYSAAKSAYLGMVRTLATEVSPHGVRVNAIAPGWIDSPMMRHALASDPARSHKILDRTPLHRFGQPDDIGWAAVYLCSPAARFLTGVTLPVDGGVSIGF